MRITSLVTELASFVASVVTLDVEQTADLFDAVETDRFEDWYQKNGEIIDELPPAGQVL